MKNLDSFAILIPFSFAAIIGLTLLQNPPKKNTIEVEGSMSVSPTPIMQKTEEVSASDGTKKLTLIKSFNPEGTINYDFVVHDPKTASKTVYRETLPKDFSFTLPLNSWSNDNTKFFITKLTPYGTQYYLFKADGTPFSDGQPFIDIGQYWDKNNTDLKINALTGWADKDLIVVYTTKIDGTKGSTYWFVVSSRKFTRLSEIPE